MKNGKPIALLVGVLLVLAGTLYTVKHLRDQEPVSYTHLTLATKA